MALGHEQIRGWCAVCPAGVSDAWAGGSGGDPRGRGRPPHQLVNYTAQAESAQAGQSAG